MNNFKGYQDRHSAVLECVRCGEELAFGNSTPPEEIERELTEHRCKVRAVA